MRKLLSSYQILDVMVLSVPTTSLRGEAILQLLKQMAKLRKARLRTLIPRWSDSREVFGDEEASQLTSFSLQLFSKQFDLRLFC